jgi:hypothetical protein
MKKISEMKENEVGYRIDGGTVVEFTFIHYQNESTGFCERCGQSCNLLPPVKNFGYLVKESGETMLITGYPNVFETRKEALEYIKHGYELERETLNRKIAIKDKEINEAANS